MTQEEADAINEQLCVDYRTVFGQAGAPERVLDDLMMFCKFRDPIGTGEDEGKRRVFLRIMQFLTFTPAQLRAVYQQRPFMEGKANDRRNNDHHDG